MDKERPPSMPFYFKQFSGDGVVTSIDADVVGFHILLICYAGSSEQRFQIENDDEILRRLCRSPSDENWARIKKQLLRMWKPSPDGKWLVQHGMRRVILRQKEFSDKQTAKIQRRWNDTKPIPAVSPDSYQTDTSGIEPVDTGGIDPVDTDSIPPVSEKTYLSSSSSLASASSSSSTSTLTKEGPPENPPPEGKVKESPEFSKLKAKLCSWFGRDLASPWSKKEVRAFREVLKLRPTDEDYALLEPNYKPTKARYRRKSIYSLLNNWNGELDKGRGRTKEDDQPMLLNRNGHTHETPDWVKIKRLEAEILKLQNETHYDFQKDPVKIKLLRAKESELATLTQHA